MPPIQTATWIGHRSLVQVPQSPITLPPSSTKKYALFSVPVCAQAAYCVSDSHVGRFRQNRGQKPSPCVTHRRLHAWPRAPNPPLRSRTMRAGRGLCARSGSAQSWPGSARRKYKSGSDRPRKRHSLSDRRSVSKWALERASFRRVEHYIWLLVFIVSLVTRRLKRLSPPKRTARSFPSTGNWLTFRARYTDFGSLSVGKVQSIHFTLIMATSRQPGLRPGPRFSELNLVGPCRA